jgi:PAS domain S-box-containing protein
MTQTPRQPPSSEAQAAKLRGILESAVTAIITIDDRGLIESVNPATERLFGYGAAELVGQNVKVLMPEPYNAEHDGYIANYLATRANSI